MRALGCSMRVLAALALSGCDGSVYNCACTIIVGQESQMIGCGDSACLAGSRFGCDEDNVVALGLCLPPDLGPADGGACLPLQASCDPAAASCCPTEPDAGPALAPSCDPVSRHCCMPIGESCTGSADCCAGHACVNGGGGLHCAN